MTAGIGQVDFHRIIHIGLVSLGTAVAAWFVLANLWLVWSYGGVGWDVEAYWQAAERLRSSEPLYVTYGNANATELYRYAPWFAWTWVPLTYLPKEAVRVGWTALMLGCSLLAVWPLLRHGVWGYVAAAIGWSVMAVVTFGGNVHPAMVAMLVFAVGTRWGPVAIAVAASLKAVPILLVLVYIGRREWTKAGVTLGLTALLVAPMLLYDLSQYTTDPGGGVLLSGAAWVVGVGLASLATLYLARTRYGWLAGAVAVTLAFPRWFLYDATLLLVGLGHFAEERDSDDRADARVVNHRARSGRGADQHLDVLGG